MTFEGRSMTYRELEEAANRVAHLLAARGAGPGQCVGLLFSRSAEAIVAILAVLKTGAAYVPIDPGVPAARIAFMIADAGPVAALTTTGLADRLAGCDLAVLDIHDPVVDTYPSTALPAPDPDDIAHIIYTSGTTGIPKGVAVTHRNVTQLFDVARPGWSWRRAGVDAVSFLCVRLFGVGDLGGAVAWGAAGGGARGGGPLPGRLPRPAGC